MRILVWLICSILAVGCSTGSSDQREAATDAPVESEVESEEDSEVGDVGDGDPSVPVLKICDSAPPPEKVDQQWRNRSSRAVAKMTPRHVASDILTTGADDILIDAKFSYGRVLKDLEEEVVDIWYDDCSGSLQRLATLESDDEGWVYFRWAAEDLPAYGKYELYFHVPADNSLARSTLRILPQGTKLAVFDIDGTLTKGDGEVMRDLYTDARRIFGDRDDYRPENRPGAPEVTRHRAEVQDLVPLYVTGRPYWLKQRTHDWKDSDGFFAGHLQTTRTLREWRPSEEGVAVFKTEYLQSLQNQGFHIKVVYGDTDTDAHAYGQLGIASESIFFVGTRHQFEYGVELGEDYLEHLQMLQESATEAVHQPFVLP